MPTRRIRYEKEKKKKREREWKTQSDLPKKKEIRFFQLPFFLPHAILQVAKQARGGGWIFCGMGADASIFISSLFFLKVSFCLSVPLTLLLPFLIMAERSIIHRRNSQRRKIIAVYAHSAREERKPRSHLTFHPAPPIEYLPAAVRSSLKIAPPPIPPPPPGDTTRPPQIPLCIFSSVSLCLSFCAAKKVAGSMSCSASEGKRERVYSFKPRNFLVARPSDPIFPVLIASARFASSPNSCKLFGSLGGGGGGGCVGGHAKGNCQ